MYCSCTDRRDDEELLQGLLGVKIYEIYIIWEIRFELYSETDPFVMISREQRVP